MMWWILWAALAVYGLGFVFFFFVFSGGPAMPSLVLYRAAGWPLWLIIGWPDGEPRQMD